ncbi:putative pyranose oxidase [Collybia nuda]|uniref:Pyranose 2-oxidase n=1 Tax=Collybia nuda TaxID=64659 RepID=A0A9P5XUZ9_9AGAR|nr:putative pyranose oxidase [Collybia nuda]
MPPALLNTDTKLHPVHQESGIPEFDVFIAGSGPIGATFARLLVNAGHNVIMTEIGDQDTRVPAAHKKNEIEYQKDIDRFVKVIQGALSTVSIPTSSTVVPTLDPSAWVANDPKQMIITNGRNTFQAEHNNLGAEAVTRGVGGMSTHWTCATPEFLKGIERPKIFPDSEAKDDEEWKLLYQAARTLIGTSEHEFDHSIRHNVVLKALQEAYPDRGVKALPLACHRIAEGSPYVQWHSAENVFEDMFTDPNKKNADGMKRGFFRLLTNTRCTRFALEANTHPYKIGAAEVKDLLLDRLFPDPSLTPNFYIRAKVYITAAGAVATPQILAKSGFGGNRGSDGIIPNLGTHITEQPMTFCQIVLRQNLVDDIAKNLPQKPDWWRKAVEHHIAAHGKTDPLPIPFHDPEPQVTIPASKDFPWHTQIHRDAFSYGEVGPRVDSRVVVDLRFFAMQPGVRKNRIVFEDDISDAYGMPQPTFEYTPSREAALAATRMMNDMTDVANKLGGYLPDSNPQFMTPGLALHLGGTVRAGHGSELDESVANYNSQVWHFSNLYVGGNGVIPTPFGANPTLTSICMAMRSAYKIHQDLKAKNLTPALPDKDVITPTPKEWLAWAFNKDDPNFPNHNRTLHRHV